MVRRAHICIVLVFGLTGCAGEANHLGNPILLPVSAVSSGIENANYGARRAKVKRFVTANKAEIHRDISRKSGPDLSKAMDLARVKHSKRALLIAELHLNNELYVQPNIEPLVVALMVHGD